MTGGAGFVGSHIVDLLVECGCDEVIVVDDLVRGRVVNLAGAMESGRVRLVVADPLRDGALLADLLQGIDTVFHQAALGAACPAAEPRRAGDGGATGTTLDLLLLCVRAGVRKVVVASSDPVLGSAGAPVAAGSREPCGDPALGDAGDVCDEGLLRAFGEAHGLSYVALRYCDVYGPRMDVRAERAETLIRWMDRLDAGLAPVIFGDGQRTVDMVHVEDVARASVLAAISPASAMALDVGGGEETSLADLAGLLARIMGRRSLRPEFRPARSAIRVPRRLADSGAAREGIGFEASIPLFAGLEELVTWWCTERDQAAPLEVAT